MAAALQMPQVRLQTSASQPLAQPCQVAQTPRALQAEERDAATSVPLAWASSLGVEGELGNGAYATIFRVVERSSQHAYAMKVINRPFFACRGLSHQLDAEVNTLRRVAESGRHRHISLLFAHIEESDHMYLRMELCKCDLLTHTNSRPNNRLPEIEAATWTQHLFTGLSDLHSLGCIHRDIKPENLLCTADGILKIADFGWCADLHESPSTLAGTFHYMAPEVLGESGIQTGAVDVWSSGVTMLQLMTGVPLLTSFLGPGCTGLSATDPNRATKLKLAGLLAEVQEKCPPAETARPAYLSQPCWSFLKRLLAKNLVHRASVADALGHHWLKALNPEATRQQQRGGIASKDAAVTSLRAAVLHVPTPTRATAPPPPLPLSLEERQQGDTGGPAAIRALEDARSERERDQTIADLVVSCEGVFRAPSRHERGSASLRARIRPETQLGTTPPAPVLLSRPVLCSPEGRTLSRQHTVLQTPQHPGHEADVAMSKSTRNPSARCIREARSAETLPSASGPITWPGATTRVMRPASVAAERQKSPRICSPLSSRTPVAPTPQPQLLEARGATSPLLRSVVARRRSIIS